MRISELYTTPHAPCAVLYFVSMLTGCGLAFATDSRPQDMESTRSTLFGFLTAWFLGEYLHQMKLFGDVDTKLIAHFHEWLAGVGLVLLRVRKLPVRPNRPFPAHAAGPLAVGRIR